MQQTPNQDLQFDDTQYQQNQPEIASSEINMLTQSNGEQWWDSKNIQAAIENGEENSRLFSPLSSMHNRGEFTPLDNLPKDDLKYTVKKMQLGFAQSQNSLMT